MLELAPRCRAAGARLHRRGSETRPRKRPGPGAGDDCVQRGRQGLAGDAGRRRDNQVLGAISTVHRTELTEHGTGAGEKMLIDPDLMPVQHNRAGLLPRGRIGLPPGSQ